MSATHGVVDEEFHNLARRVAGIDKVVAQLVTDNILIRSELTNHQLEPMVRRLEALEQQVVKLEHDVEHVPPAERQLMLDGFVAEVRETADGMSKRLRILEACIQGIEAKLKLRRKDDPEKVIEALDSPTSWRHRLANRQHRPSGVTTKSPVAVGGTATRTVRMMVT